MNPSLKLLAALNRGTLADWLDDEIADLTQAIRDTGKTGSLTITLSMKPDGPNNELLRIVPKVKTTTPTQEAAPLYRFIAADGSLVADDPNQGTLDLGPRATPITLDQAKGDRS